MSIIKRKQRNDPIRPSDSWADLVREAAAEGIVLTLTPKVEPLDDAVVERMSLPPAWRDGDDAADDYLRHRFTELHWLRDRDSDFYDAELWRQLVVWNDVHLECPDLFGLERQ